MSSTTTSIHDLLGADAESLLTHQCTWYNVHVEAIQESIHVLNRCRHIHRRSSR